MALKSVDGGASDQMIVPTLAHFRIAENIISVDPDNFEKPEEQIGKLYRDVAISIAEALFVEWGDTLPKELQPTFVDIPEDEDELTVVED